MSNDAKMSLILCQDLAPNEQEKVEGLHAEICAQLHNAGQVVRLCRGRNRGAERRLDFCRDLLGTEVIAAVPSRDFVAATNSEALAMIEP